MNRADYKLCREVAELWVSRGGDSEGITYNLHLLKQAVDEVRKEREEREGDCE